MADPAQRTYGGVVGTERVAGRRERLLAAGLDLLGSPDGPQLTVRGVCKRSGLIARYFYESFDDLDALAVAVHEAVIEALVADGLAALESAPDAGRDRLRAGLGAIVAHLADDPRRGHVIFGAALTVPALVERRPEVIAMFAGLLRDETVRDPRRAGTDRSRETVLRFLVGGFGEVLTGWLTGALQVSQDELVEACVALFEAAARSAP